MANVSIKFNGKEFLLSCEDGQEEHLEELLIQINKKFNNLKNDLGNLGENKLLLITAVKVMDEYYETKKKVDQKKDGILITGLPHSTDYSDEALKKMVNDMQLWKKVRMIGSAAMASCYIASGKAEMYKENGIYLWEKFFGDNPIGALPLVIYHLIQLIVDTLLVPIFEKRNKTQ